MIITRRQAQDEGQYLSEDAAACQLYAAECALHSAHQTRDDAWIFAASERLHEAVTDHAAARTDLPT